MQLVPTSGAEVVLVRVLKLGLVQQLVQADNLLVVQLCRRCVLVHATPHLRYQPSCISQPHMQNRQRVKGSHYKQV